MQLKKNPHILMQRFIMGIATMKLKGMVPMGKIGLVQPIRNHEKIEEMKQILLEQSYRDYFLFSLGINTGFRVSDLLRLKVVDVRNKSHIIITEEKTNKKRKIKLTVIAANLIDGYVKGKGDQEYLFPSKKTKLPIGRIQAYKILNQAAVKCGLTEIGTHTMRKTFGYHLYKKRKDVALLMEIFNHSSPQITLRYIGINQEEMDNALDDFGL